MTTSPKEGAATRRPLVLASLLVLGVTAVLLPFSAHQLEPSASFMPATLAVDTSLDVMTVYLLVAEYRDGGDVRLLGMSLAYVWSLITMFAYALAFPGVISAHPPLALTPSMAVWLYLTWHTGFPVLLGIAWAPWPSRWSQPSPASRRGRVCGLSILALSGAAVSVIALLLVDAHSLPVLIHGLNFNRMTTLTAPIVLPLVALSVLVTGRGTRHRSGPERWSTVASWLCMCDLILTYGSRHRYTLGWYVGRSLTIVAAGAVFVAVLASFRRLKAQAERDATIDPLTSVANRRSGWRSLEQMAARSNRSGSPLGVVAFDLDEFKSVNDRFGHEAGDRVLRAVGEYLRTSLRTGDEPVRMGGEEFLILLPDTDAQEALTVAENIRRGIAAISVPGVDAKLAASLGAGCWEEGQETTGELLVRVDQALYRAKHQGRNRALAATPLGAVV